MGDGFPVRSLFSLRPAGCDSTSPFLLLDYAGPAQFAPAAQPRGVGEHPHRGFETVTIVYRGEVAHRDSSGNGGIDRSGRRAVDDCGVAGILHEEFHSPEFTRSGGALEMAQLWVNLPAGRRMSDAPLSEHSQRADIPRVERCPRARAACASSPASSAGDPQGPARRVHRAQRLGPARLRRRRCRHQSAGRRRTTPRRSRCCAARSPPTALAAGAGPPNSLVLRALRRWRCTSMAAQADSTLLLLERRADPRTHRRLRAIRDELTGGDRNRGERFPAGQIRAHA